MPQDDPSPPDGWASPAEQSCPTCGEAGEWMEEHSDTLEFGCVNNHTWHVEKRGRDTRA